MTTATIIPRRTGATAVLSRQGHPQVTSATGGVIDVVTRPSEAGFNPLDLLYASLSACLVLSARIAASERGVLDKLHAVEARVGGTKAEKGPSRIERFSIELIIDADLTEAAKDEIAAAAERMCTISNTLHNHPVFEVARIAR